MDAYVEKRPPQGSFGHLFEALVCSRESPGQMAAPHCQETYEILYGLDGSCLLHLGAQAHAMHAGDMALFDPMEPHMVDCVAPRCEYIVLKFGRELLCPADHSMDEARLFMRYENCPAAHRKVFPAAEMDPEAPRLIRRMLEESRKRPFGYELGIRADMARLFLWIMRHSPVPALSREEVGAEDDRVMRRALEYIGERFLFDISLAEVADYCGMGYTAFSRLFTRSMQVSFPDYVQRRRLEHADILLATTDKRVTEVAMEAGFSSVSYFIYCFRKLRGVTPARFRRDFASPPGAAG